MKKIICILLALCLALGLCACGGGQGGTTTESGTNTANTLPDQAYGTWYPHPAFEDGVIEIRADGTCSVFGMETAWTLESQTKSEAVLNADGYRLSLSQLDTPLPVLEEDICGLCVRDAELWYLAGEWYCPDTGESINVDFRQLPQEYTVQVDGSRMTLELLEGETLVYTIELDGTGDEPVAIMTDMEGNTLVFYSMEYGSGDVSGGDSGIQELAERLETVLSGGVITDYVDDDGVEHVISGSEALGKLYQQFAALGTPEAQEYLSHFELREDVLVASLYTTSLGTEMPGRYTYNAYGQSMNPLGDLPLASGEFCNFYWYYNLDGTETKVSIFNSVLGTPVYDSEGRLSAVNIVARDKDYTATLTYNEKGQVVRIDIPVNYSYQHVDLDPEDFYEYQEFLYNDAGQLQQSSVTIRANDTSLELKIYGCYMKYVTEYIYDADGRLVKSIEHETHPLKIWIDTTSVYTYDSAGNPVLEEITSMFFPSLSDHGLESDVRHQKIYNVVNRLFHSDGPVDSEALYQELSITSFLDPEDMGVQSRIEYVYEDIYAYVP